MALRGKIEPTDEQLADLHRLVRLGYGDSSRPASKDQRAVVAEYLIARGLDDLRRSGVLPTSAKEGE